MTPLFPPTRSCLPGLDPPYAWKPLAKPLAFIVVQVVVENLRLVPGSQLSHLVMLKRGLNRSSWHDVLEGIKNR